MNDLNPRLVYLALGFWGILAMMPARLGAEDAISQPPPPETAPIKAEGGVPGASLVEKALPAARPTAQPQFTLPEVVITGENQLTIGAQRLERHEDDVTLGSRELRGLSRSGDELPGLDKARTGTSALSPEEPRDTAMALHLGGGIPESIEGWALLGHQLNGFGGLLHGYGEKCGGEDVASGKTAFESMGWGVVLQAAPHQRVSLRLSREYARDRNDMPWHSTRENRNRMDLDGEARWRFAPSWWASARGRFLDTRLEGADGSLSGYGSARAREREGRVRVQWDGSGPFAQGIWLEAGGRESRGDFIVPLLSRYDVAWGRLGVRFQPTRRLSLETAFGAKNISGRDLSGRGEPSAVLDFTLSENSRLKFHWRRELTLPTFQGIRGEAAHTSVQGGLPVPGFVKDDIGGEWSRRMADRVTVVLGGRGWREENLSQWNEPALDAHLQQLEVVGSIRAWEARMGLDVDLPKRGYARADYLLSEGEDKTGAGKKLTLWPRHTGVLALGRDFSKGKAQCTFQAAARREGASSREASLPPYGILGFEFQRVMSKTLTIWARGENLTGTKYELRPGYPEPRFHARAGLEWVF